MIVLVCDIIIETVSVHHGSVHEATTKYNHSTAFRIVPPQVTIFLHQISHFFLLTILQSFCFLIHEAISFSITTYTIGHSYYV